MSAFALARSLERAQLRLENQGKARGSAPNTTETPGLLWGALPAEVQAALYNLGSPAVDTRVPAEVVAFYAFNYGEVRALSFASALPLASLERATRMTGWRPKSLALAQAIVRQRGHS